MSSFFQRIFRPKWQHQDANIRRQAIEQMDPRQEDHLKVLKTLCLEDPSSQVRAAASEKMTDIRELSELAIKTTPEKSPEIAERLNLLAGSAPQEALQGIPTAVKVALIPWIQSESLCSAFIAEVTDQSQLAELASQGKTTRLRQIAVEQITDTETLKSIQSQVKNKDKRVYQLVREKLAHVKDAEKQQAEQTHQVATLLDQLQQIAVCEVNKLTEPRFRALESRWESLNSVTLQPLAEQIQETRRVCEQRIGEYNAKKSHELEALAANEEQSQERQGTLDTLESTVEDLKNQAATDAARLVALDAVLKTQETRWLEATRNADVSKAEQKQYQALMTDIRQYLAAAKKLQTSESEMQAILEAGKQEAAADRSASRKLQTMLTELNWPSAFPEPALIRAAQDFLGIVSEIRLKKEADIQEASDLIEKKLKELDSLIESRALKPSQKLIREVQKRIQQLPEKVGARYSSRLTLSFRQLKDLEDWAGFATQPKQIELCERMEALAEQSLDPQFKADKIQELQKLWKGFGGSSDQALWQRFKSASDTAYEPCQAFFKEQNELKQQNLQKRESICASMRSLLDGIAWESADWKGLDKISRTAKKEWKEAYPVDFKQGKSLQKQFNDLIEALDGQLNDEKAKNQHLKEALVQKSAELVSHESVQDAINQAKMLQKQWSDIGITDFVEDRKLWKSFRGHCDAIFARRDAQKAAETERQAADRAQAQAIAEKAELLAELLPGDQPMKALEDLENEHRSLALPNDEKTRIQKVLSKCREEIHSKLEARKNQAYQEKWRAFLELSLQGTLTDADTNRVFDAQLPGTDNLKRAIAERVTGTATHLALPLAEIIENARDACIMLEILLGAESPEEDQARRTALQIARLNAGMKGDKPSSNRNEQVCEWLALWLSRQATGELEETAITAEIPRLRSALTIH